MDKVKSLTIALVVVAIAAVAFIGVSYSRQKNAENKVAFLNNAINSTDDLEELRNLSGGLDVYSGSGTSASAHKYIGSADGQSCYRNEHGSDAGTVSCYEDVSWWNPMGWFQGQF